jgi:type III secretory pathway component EscV
MANRKATKKEIKQRDEIQSLTQDLNKVLNDNEELIKLLQERKKHIEILEAKISDYIEEGLELRGIKRLVTLAVHHGIL